MVRAVTLLILASMDEAHLAVALSCLAVAGIVGVFLRAVHRAAAGQRAQARVADLAGQGDLDGAVASVEGRSPEERGRALAGGAGLLVERALQRQAEAAYEDDEDEEAPLDPRVDAACRALVARAREAAPRDGRTLSFAAAALQRAGAWEACEQVLEAAQAAPDLDGVVLFELAGVAREVEAADVALALAERGLRARPADLELVAIRGWALLELDRPDEAVPSLEAALSAVRIQRASIGANYERLEAIDRELEQLHEDAVRRSSSAEKTIDTHVLQGRLDPRAGVNYKLMAHSLLVESTRRARRLLLPSQAELLRDAQADPDAVVGLEDAALHALREGTFERAEELFRRAADLAPGGWPVLAGLGATLELRRAPPWRTLPPAPDLPALARLVEPWAALTEVERQLVALALAPVAHLVPALADAGAKLQVVALDAKLTDLPAFAGAAGELVEDEDDRRTHDAIDGMAIGLTAAIKIEAFHERDEERWTLAHELGHVLQHFLEARAGDEAEAFTTELDQLFAKAEGSAWLSTEYGLRNVFEFFATGYERFALRHAFPDAPRTEVHGADIDLGVDAFLREWTAP
jgi:hypothetical protein